MADVEVPWPCSTGLWTWTEGLRHRPTKDYKSCVLWQCHRRVASVIFWVFCGLLACRAVPFLLPIFSKHRTRNYLGKVPSSLGYAFLLPAALMMAAETYNTPPCSPWLCSSPFWAPSMMSMIGASRGLAGTSGKDGQQVPSRHGEARRPL